MANAENSSDRLQAVNSSELNTTRQQPDITGWEIFDAAGYYIGDVDSLIFDRDSLKIRYIVTDLDDLERAYSHPEVVEQKQVLIPIGLVTLNEDEVILTEEVANSIGLLPLYEGGIITPAYEIQIRDILTGNLQNMESSITYEKHPDNFYEHQHFSENGYKAYQTGRDGLDEGQVI
jgi:hypothetical protein